MPGRIPTHRPQRADLPDGRLSSDRRGYNTAWRVARLAFLRAHPLCSHPGCERPATEVDHAVSIAKGGSNDESNLIQYCKSHHSAKTVKVDGGFGRTPNGQ